MLPAMARKLSGMIFSRRLVCLYLLLGCASTAYFLGWYSSTPDGGPHGSIYRFLFKDRLSVLQPPWLSYSTTDALRCGPTTNGNCETANAKAVFDAKVLYQTVESVHNSLYSRKHGSKCVPRLPSCIIIGVKKSGTRELIDFMAMHPNIVIKHKPIYELNYFVRPIRPLKWYKQQMPCSYPDQITVTKSPFYFSNPHVPGRLHQYNSTLKMVLLVREPIARVLSGISFERLSKKFVKRPPREGVHGEIVNHVNGSLKLGISFERLYKKFAKRPPNEEVDGEIVNHVNGSVKLGHGEIQLSTYDTAMERYLKYFSRDQILIIETGEFKVNPAGVLKRVEAFLGLKHHITEDMFAYNSEKQFYCLRRDFVPAFSPQAIDHMVCYGDNRGRIKQKPLREDTLKILKKYFDAHNEEFFKLINKRFDW